MGGEDFTINLKRYIKLYKSHQKEEDPDIQDEIQEKMEELWYNLNDEEIAFIEINNLNI